MRLNSNQMFAFKFSVRLGLLLLLLKRQIDFLRLLLIQVRLFRRIFVEGWLFQLIDGLLKNLLVGLIFITRGATFLILSASAEFWKESIIVL